MNMLVLALTLTPAARNFVIGIIVVLVIGAIAGGDPGDRDPIDPTEFDRDGFRDW